jgi:hypothetical protein
MPDRERTVRMLDLRRIPAGLTLLTLVSTSFVVPACAQAAKPASHIMLQTPSPLPRLPALSELPNHPEMPDPLLRADGLPIKTRAEWEARRGEMRRMIEYYLVGTMPPPPGNVTGRQTEMRSVLDGKATFRRFHLTFGPKAKLGFDVAVFTPTANGGKEPFPTFVHPSFAATPGTGASEPDPDAAAAPFAEALTRGYAVLTYDYRQTAADTPATRESGFFAAYPGYDWGAEGAWAWGMSRCVDFLETQPFANKNQLIAVGHSRLGKATLIAGAFDDRFALVAPAGSGCMGTGAFRFSGKTHGGKEGLDEYTARFPYQVSPRLPQFAGHVEKLPFDQHWLVALVAPRPFFAAEALGDPYCNGHAFQETFLHALPVYQFLGAAEKIGFHFRTGGHAFTPEDWTAILDFADQTLRGTPSSRTFQEFPPADKLH